MDTTVLFTLPEPLIATVLNYLATRPYNEVVGLIDQIQKQAVRVETDGKTVAGSSAKKSSE